jgi:hypothetical protein
LVSSAIGETEDTQSHSSSPPKILGRGKKQKYVINTARFTAHYDIVENREKLWSTRGVEQDLTEALLPCLLALPTFVAEFLGATNIHHMKNQ